MVLLFMLRSVRLQKTNRKYIIGRREKKMQTRLPLNQDELENLVLQHIRMWVEHTNGHECPDLFRDYMDDFTNSFRRKWFDYEKKYHLRKKEVA